MATRHTFTGKVWLYPGDTAWHFVRVDKEISAALKNKFGSRARGFGSLPVEVTVGKTTWQTSIFPDSQSGTYLLPLKAKVRHAEGVGDGDVVQVLLRVRMA